MRAWNPDTSPGTGTSDRIWPWTGSTAVGCQLVSIAVGPSLVDEVEVDDLGEVGVDDVDVDVAGSAVGAGLDGKRTLLGGGTGPVQAGVDVEVVGCAVYRVAPGTSRLSNAVRLAG